MGSDTCWLEIEFRRSDLPKFDEILAEHIDDEGMWWSEELSDDPNSATMKVTVYEANGAWGDELKHLAEVGLSFTVANGPGDDYGPCVLACYQGDVVECSADWDSNPVVPVRRSGIDDVACEACDKYWYLVQQMEEEPRKFLK